MTYEELNHLKWRRPFQPFRVTTTENETFDVLHPGLIIVATNGVTIGLPHPQEPPPMARDMVWLGAEDIRSADPIQVNA